MVLQKLPLIGLLLLLTIVASPANADGPVCPPSNKLSRASFPEGFLFGTATAAYQVQYKFLCEHLLTYIYTKIYELFHTNNMLPCKIVQDSIYS